MDINKNIPDVNAPLPSDAKALLVEELKAAIEEMKLIRAGETKARDADDFLNELSD